MVTRAKKTEYWILNTFPCNRVLLCNMLIYTANYSFRHRKNIEMCLIRNRVRFLTKFQIESILLKIAPYHRQKFGRYRNSSYLCTSNRRNSLSCQKAVIIEDRSWSKMMAGAGHLWRPKSRMRSPSRSTPMWWPSRSLPSTSLLTAACIQELTSAPSSTWQWTAWERCCSKARICSETINNHEL